MKRYPGNHSSTRCRLLSLVLAAGLVLPLASLADPVALATSPLATSTTSTVKPNLLLVLDNSGSMNWEHMPDDKDDLGSSVTFSFGYYGLRSSQCNQVYYDPTITYLAPAKADGTNFADASFAAALPHGYLAAGANIVSADGTKDFTNNAVNLSTGFKASLPASYTSVAGDTQAQSAYYYTYSGTQTTPLQKNYNSTSNTFYNECHSASGATPGSTVFDKRRLAATETTTITVTASVAPIATITVSGSNSSPVSSVKVNGVTITSAGNSTGSSTNSTEATNLAGKITVGVAGYSAAVLSGSTITITGPPGAAGFTPVVTKASGTDTFTTSVFTNPSVSSIKVNGVELMASAATGSSTTSATATDIASKITQNSFTATAAGNVITITGPTSAVNFTPVITSSGGITVTPGDPFPDTDTVKLTNFANWYSYYRTRMLMMKTATGRAFKNVDKNYRVGLMKISASTTPTVYVDTFWDNTDTTLGAVSTQRTTWYNTFYATTATASTPLREALAHAGMYYAGKLAGADPLQYSCQQNFTILSTDGYWNTGSGFKLDGSTAVGNQDGTAGRPMSDGFQAFTTVTTKYTHDNYSTSSSGCTSPKKRLVKQPEIQSCTVTIVGGVAGAENCTVWSTNGSSSYVAPGASCTSTTLTLPSPNPTSRAISGTPVTTPGTSGGTSETLADVAMYYYQTDLRDAALHNCGTPADTGPLCDNNVFKSDNDKNTQQHMNTFTLGLGASGWMTYSSSYLNDDHGDYFDVKLGSTAHPAATPPVCPWQADGTVCNWPIPGMTGSDGLIANVDDLWHAAINGRGAYFSATNPTTLSAGLSSALTGINAKLGSAAAAATSTLNPVSGNNLAYVASYTTGAWKGNLEARGINTDTGVVSETATWCAESVAEGACSSPGTKVAESTGDTAIFNCVTPHAVICTGGVMDGTDCKVQMATLCTGTMNAIVADASDTRTIKTANSAGNALMDFQYANLDAANFAAAHIGTLSQWTTLTADQKTAAEGVNLVNYLRGQRGHEFDRTGNAVLDQLYRNRETVLGDALESQPAFIGKPVFSYPYPGYSGYVTNQSGRAGTVYMGANDGMMHAFDALTGQERWAYVPSMVIPNMWQLASTGYKNAHANFVNGSAITSDICSANCTDVATAVWKTILVAGLNGGGRGYYALDITIPDTPKLLWEFTPSTGIGKIKDNNLGYTFGQPIITRKSDGSWVVLVTSGYDNGTLSSDPLVANSIAGDGQGYLYVLDANAGTIISRISTGVGTATTPSGLARIAGWNDEPAGNKVGFVYGGDLLGNVWRFDINSTVDAAFGKGDVLKLATLCSDTSTTCGSPPAANSQPVTTTPVLGTILGKRVVFIGTGKYLEIPDLTTTQTQTQYAIKDDNATTTLVNPRNTLVHQFLIKDPNGDGTRLSSGASTSAPINKVDFLTSRGWFVDFPDGGTGGGGSERVNIDAKLVEGTLLVPTIVPSSTVCAPGGFGWLNFFDYKTGGAVVTGTTGTGLASSKYDSTIVGVNVLYEQGKPIVEVVTSTNPTPKKDPDVAFNATPAGFTGKRVIWRELIP